LKERGTELYPIIDGDYSLLEKYWDEIVSKANTLGFPLFMRTDEFSGKHNWKHTCFVESLDVLKKHISNLFEDSFSADILGLPIRAIVLRRYIPMKNLFTAFAGDMPVNPEIRFFVKDGKILCKHWYWVEDAIERGTPARNLPADWKDIIGKQKEMLNMDILDFEVLRVAKDFVGCWSMDFCLSEGVRWVLIDMAKGLRSWHPDDCINEKIIREDS
jgi:hypothetical protein